MSVFIDIVHASDLSEEDKELWVDLVGALNEEQLDVLADYASRHENGLGFLTENLKAKQSALAGGDEEAIFKIMNDEKIIG